MVRYWKNTGIDLIGKISPDNINAGRNPATTDAILANSWFFRTLEIIRPIPRQANKNNALTPNKAAKLPRKGISKTKIIIKTLKDKDIMPTTK